jgi:hypothetical protein
MGLIQFDRVSGLGIYFIKKGEDEGVPALGHKGEI